MYDCVDHLLNEFVRDIAGRGGADDRIVEPI